MKKNPVKRATIEQVEKKQAKAVNFLRNIVQDDDKADEIAALSPQEYAERKHITINPKSGKRKNPKCNPDDETAAADTYEMFHGQEPKEVIRLQTDEIGRDTYTALGELLEMALNASGENYKLDFTGCKVKLCSSADKKQLYVVGGDQDCSACLPKDSPDKDIVILGVLKRITYVTRKQFDKFQESAYEHKFGEDGGEPPIALYVRTHKRIFIADGTYRIEMPGIID
jgi:hypothetical protein